MVTPSQPLTDRVVERGSSRLVAYDFGAHLASWEVDGRPVIRLAEQAVLDGSRAIRGGIPLCFPWFADGPGGSLSPSHGVVRTATWRPTASTGTEIWAWELTSDDVAGAPGHDHLDGPFALRYAVSLADPGHPPRLQVELLVTNPADTPVRVEAALHTYLAVADLTRTSLTGLDGAAYLDKLDGVRHRQDGPVHLEGAIDNVYDSPGSPCVSVDDGERVLDVHAAGATQCVVWNPGPEQAATMSDLGDAEWRRFVCVEAAATGEHALHLPPGGSHRLGCTVTVQQDTVAP